MLYHILLSRKGQNPSQLQILEQDLPTDEVAISFYQEHLQDLCLPFYQETQGETLEFFIRQQERVVKLIPLEALAVPSENFSREAIHI